MLALMLRIDEEMSVPLSAISAYLYKVSVETSHSHSCTLLCAVKSENREFI